MALRRVLPKLLHKHTSSPLIPNRDPIHTPGFSRRRLQHRAVNDSYTRNAFPFLGVDGEKLQEQRKPLNLDPLGGPRFGGVTVEDTKRILRFVQLEKLRERLMNIPVTTISYADFVGICAEVCRPSEDGFDYAKALDDSGNVIVLGRIVFLRPNQVAKSVERLISQAIALPNDPRRKELDGLENQKGQIDSKAQALVRGELYCGLGLLVLQTLGFMRLTFWELSWDVMEPICFFVTSLYFALAYAFFLRTSKEPTFEGYFQRRFKVKQTKLMKIHNFDVQRYNQLCQVFYPGYNSIECRERARITCLGSIPASV